MMFRRRLPYDYDSSEIAGLREEKTSLQPLAAEILPPPRKARTSSSGSLVVGMVIGVALSLPITTWAVRAHRWPGQGSVGDGAPATSMCPAPQQPAQPPLVAASALPAAQPEVPAVFSCDREIATALAAAADKAKKRKHRGFRPANHAAAAAAPEPEESTESIEERASAELQDSLR